MTQLDFGYYVKWPCVKKLPFCVVMFMGHTRSPEGMLDSSAGWFDMAFRSGPFLSFPGGSNHLGGHGNRVWLVDLRVLLVVSSSRFRRTQILGGFSKLQQTHIHEREKTTGEKWVENNSPNLRVACPEVCWAGKPFAFRLSPFSFLLSSFFFLLSSFSFLLSSLSFLLSSFFFRLLFFFFLLSSFSFLLSPFSPPMQPRHIKRFPCEYQGNLLLQSISPEKSVSTMLRALSFGEPSRISLFEVVESGPPVGVRENEKEDPPLRGVAHICFARITSFFGSFYCTKTQRRQNETKSADFGVAAFRCSTAAFEEDRKRLEALAAPTSALALLRLASLAGPEEAVAFGLGTGWVGGWGTGVDGGFLWRVPFWGGLKHEFKGMPCICGYFWSGWKGPVLSASRLDLS